MLIMNDMNDVDAVNERSWGEYQNDYRHGIGTYNFPNGNTYTGNWIKGNITGHGIFIWSDGDRYEIGYS